MLHTVSCRLHPPSDAASARSSSITRIVELQNGKTHRGHKILLLVNRRNVRLFRLFANYGDAVGVLLPDALCFGFALVYGRVSAALFFVCQSRLSPLAAADSDTARKDLQSPSDEVGPFGRFRTAP